MYIPNPDAYLHCDLSNESVCLHTPPLQKSFVLVQVTRARYISGMRLRGLGAETTLPFQCQVALVFF